MNDWELSNKLSNLALGLRALMLDLDDKTERA